MPIPLKLRLVRFVAIIAACVAALLLTSWPGYAAQGFAGSAEERAVLARLNNEIEALTPLIEEARRASAQPSGRFRFEYDALLGDLRRVSGGIREMLQQPDTTPRDHPALAGDYLR